MDIRSSDQLFSNDYHHVIDIDRGAETQARIFGEKQPIEHTHYIMLTGQLLLKSGRGNLLEKLACTIKANRLGRIGGSQW